MALAPIFFLCIAAEYGLGQRRGKLPDSAQYYLPEVACNFVLAGLHQAADILTGLLIAHFYLWMFDWRLFDIEMSVLTFLLLMLLQDFFSITGSTVLAIVFVGCGRHMWCITVQKE